MTIRFESCLVWSNTDVVIHDSTPKMSLANGLVYGVSKPAGPGTTDRWCIAAIDFRTGKTVWQTLTGTGNLFDPHYGGIFIGRDGTLYATVQGGVVAMRDGS